MEIGVLGPLAVVHRDRELTIGGPQRRTLLALLATHANEAVSVGYLIDQLWGEDPPPAARKSLQAHIAHLRRVLNVDQTLLRAQPPGYVLALDTEQLDSLRFEKLVRDAIPKLEHDPKAAREELTEALAIWRGAPLADVADESPALRAQVTRLGELRLVAWEHRIDADLRIGHHAEVAAELEHLVSVHPLRERLWAQLMTALYRSGRQADALAAFQRARRLLAEELGIEPSGELVSLEERILLHSPELESVPAPASHAQPTGADLEAGGGDSRLPVEVSSFIGREHEKERLTILMGEARLVTITGAGGSGKTRLALQVANRTRDFPDGVWFVGLAGLDQPDLVPQEVGRALQLHERTAQEWMQTLHAYLKSRRLLIVLDNCEHLGSPVADLCAALLQSAPHLRILATSREPLGVPGETTWQIPLLSNPASETPITSIDALLAFDAPRLFIERARGARPDLNITDAEAPVIADLCRRLDGLPLALELAAARVRVMSPEEIVSHMDDRFSLLAAGPRVGLARHQTIEATVAWSYDLLSRSEQDLFERLSVFHGGFDLAGAIEVGGQDVLGGIVSLVDKSLLIAEPHDGETRYRMLETVAAFARRASGDRLSTSKDAHLQWMTRFSRMAAANLERRDQAKWVGRVQTEIDNVRAALEWAHQSGDFASGMLICSSLFNYWYMRGAVEGRRWLDSFLAVSPVVPDEVMAWALFVAGALRHQEGDHESDSAAALLERGLELFEKIKDPHGIAYSLHHLARTHWGRLAPEELRQEFTTALERFNEVEDWVGVATSLLFIVWVELGFGDPGQAVEVGQQVYELSRRVGSTNLRAHGSEFLGTALWNHGDYETARRHLHEALLLYEEVGNAQCSAHCLDSAAAWSLGLGDAGTAARLLAAVDALRAEIGLATPRWERFIHDSVRARLAEEKVRDGNGPGLSNGESLGLDGALALALRVTADTAT